MIALEPSTNAETIPLGTKVTVSLATDTTYSKAVEPLFCALLITRALIPSTSFPNDGEYTPFSFSNVQELFCDRTTSKEFFTFVLVLQNGQSELDLVSSELRSRSPFPPVHACGSFSGSFPENENLHELFFRSISINRSLPGQFES
ncbi:MAG: hypothetical protein EBR53_02575 [Actinobacteria bacterium]|nr:hypothetical protein [Actinomycetota bacterium]